MMKTNNMKSIKFQDPQVHQHSTLVTPSRNRQNLLSHNFSRNNRTAAVWMAKHLGCQFTVHDLMNSDALF